MGKRSAIIFLFALQVSVVSAQSFFSPTAWRTLRREVGASFGASNFLGELGGKDAIGTNFLKDWEFSMVRISAQVYHSYYLNPSTTIKTNINYAWIQGDDKLTAEPFRNNRNLHFRSMVYEFNTSIQWLLLKEKMGNKFGLRNTRNRKIGVRSNSVGVYLTAGIGVLYFNPKAQYNGKWRALQPLHTEGQGLQDGPRQYKRVTMSIPLGIGFRKSFSRQTGMYLEFTQHYTITDYLDDVSGVYYDNTSLAQNYGSASAALADPNKGLFLDPNGESYVSRAGEQRGDKKDKDNFMMLTVGMYYKIKTSTGYKRAKSKRRVKSLL